MIQPDPPDSVWLLVVGLGLGTFVLRLSFIQLYAWLDEFPPAVERSLSYVPAAVLAALVLPALVSLDGPLVSGLVNPRSVAGLVGGVVAWRTGSITATILAGMVVLWILQFAVG